MLARAGYCVRVVQLFAPAEANPAFWGKVELIDAETGDAREATITSRLARRYGALFAQFLADVREFCAQRRIGLVQVATDADCRVGRAQRAPPVATLGGARCVRPTLPLLLGFRGGQRLAPSPPPPIPRHWLASFASIVQAVAAAARGRWRPGRFGTGHCAMPGRPAWRRWQQMAAAGLLVGQRPRALVIAGPAAPADGLAGALGRARLPSSVVRPRCSPTGSSLDCCDLLVLSNVDAASVSPAAMETIARYVRFGGGGLVAIGGDHAFSVGGYRHTLLEDVLPVVSEPGQERPKPALALVLVLDRSGSMRGEKIATAKQAARRAVGLLRPGDQVGVVAFSSTAEWICPLRPCSGMAEKERLCAEIDSIAPSADTFMFPASNGPRFTAKRPGRSEARHFADRRHLPAGQFSANWPL